MPGAQHEPRKDTTKQREMSFIYFAYGSNMLPARLQARCGSARVIGTASAQAHRLEFSKPSKKDGSGKATLIRSETQTITTPGVLFEIERTELGDLDRAEGAGYGYDRDDSFTVTHATTGKTLTVTTYLATKKNTALKPFDWYLALVLAGSHYHELAEGHLNRVRAHGHVVDQDHSRKGRIEALEALAKHDFTDLAALLGGTWKKP
jgi:gamma-glutamylcyclotransferase